MTCENHSLLRDERIREMARHIDMDAARELVKRTRELEGKGEIAELIIGLINEIEYLIQTKKLEADPLEGDNIIWREKDHPHPWRRKGDSPPAPQETEGDKREEYRHYYGGMR